MCAPKYRTIPCHFSLAESDIENDKPRGIEDQARSNVVRGDPAFLVPPYRSRSARQPLSVARRFFLALCAATLLGACGGKKSEPIARGAVVLVIGDSITAGYGLGPDKAWTVALESRSGWRIVNAGISGDTSAGGRARLPALLEEHQPAAVIVELGGNDMLRRQPTAAIVANIDAMLDAVRASGARPILMATPQPSIAGAVFSSLSDAPFYAEIAQRQQVPLIADALAAVLSKADYKLDQLHPNLAGHQLLGEKVAAALADAGLLK